MRGGGEGVNYGKNCRRQLSGRERRGGTMSYGNEN